MKLPPAAGACLDAAVVCAVVLTRSRVRGFSCSMADVVIRNGQVVVGNGEPSFIGDVAIKDGKVAAVGPSLDVVGAEEVNATGLVSLRRYGLQAVDQPHALARPLAPRHSAPVPAPHRFALLRVYIGGGARVLRHPLALRCAVHLGPAFVAVRGSRRHHRDRRQLVKGSSLRGCRGWRACLSGSRST